MSSVHQAIKGLVSVSLACVACANSENEDAISSTENVATVVSAATATRVLSLPQCYSSSCGSEFPAPLTVAGITYDETTLYIAVGWNSDLGGKPTSDSTPEVLLVAAGVKVGKVASTGTLLVGSSQASPLAVPLSALPDGELTLTVRVAGHERTIPLAKHGADLEYLRDENRKGFRRGPQRFSARHGMTFSGVTIEEPAHDGRIVEVRP